MTTRTIVVALLVVPISLCTAVIKQEVAVQGEGRLECQHNYPQADIVSWKHGETQIYYKETGKENTSAKYRLESSDKKVQLIITDVQKGDAGAYTCEVYSGKDYKVLEFELLVKDSDSSKGRSSDSDSSKGRSSDSDSSKGRSSGFASTTRSSLTVTLAGFLLHMMLSRL